MTLLSRMEETLSYFRDEFPEEKFRHVWDKSICPYCSDGITPNDLVELKRLLCPEASAGNEYWTETEENLK